MKDLLVRTILRLDYMTQCIKPPREVKTQLLLIGRPIVRSSARPPVKQGVVDGVLLQSHGFTQLHRPVDRLFKFFVAVVIYSVLNLLYWDAGGSECSLQGAFFSQICPEMPLIDQFRYIKDGAYYCYCAYVLRTSRYSGFLSVIRTNTVIFLRGLKLSGVDLSKYSWHPKRILGVTMLF